MMTQVIFKETCLKSLKLEPWLPQHSSYYYLLMMSWSSSTRSVSKPCNLKDARESVRDDLPREAEDIFLVSLDDLPNVKLRGY